MKRPRFFFLFILISLVPGQAWADVVLSGMLRNDGYVVVADNEPTFLDTLEARVIFSAKKGKNWKFYTDIRAYMVYGYTEGTGPLASAMNTQVPYQGYTTAKIMRAFLRLYTKGGDFTLGKTYINIGNASLFNPFDIDRSINFTDVGADKEGIFGLEYNLFAGDLFEFKLYGGVYNPDITFNDPNLPFGLEFTFTVSSFEFGFAAVRNGVSKNIIGAFFKGDIEVGIQASYGAHFDDTFGAWYHEANIGIDYSFLNGKLIITAMGYFNSSKVLDVSDYPSYITENVTTSTLASAASGFPGGMFYFYGDITGMIDEFLTLKLMAFVNCIDGSTYLAPSVTWTIVDGINLTFMVPFVIGTGEFPSLAGYSINQGEFAALLRIEGKY